MEGRAQRGRGRGGKGGGREATGKPAKTEVPRRTRVEDGETFVPPISCNYLNSGPPPIRTAKRKPDTTPTAEAGAKKESGPPAKKPKLAQAQLATSTKKRAANQQVASQNYGEAPPKKTFLYGNYDRYYSYRNKGNVYKDPRLECFKKEWFEGKRVLDIGCNMGIVTKLIARSFSPNFILGIDIDEDLIKRAQHGLEKDQRKKDKYEQKRSRIKFGDDGRPEEQSSKELKTNATEKEQAGKETQGSTNKQAYPYNIAYQAVNFVEDKGQHDQKYDVILCLSVTKWIHLNWGDKGVKTLFRKIFDLLNEGGVLILEPQEWKSYMKKAKLTPAHKVNRRAVELRPEQFRTYLLDKLGFKHCEVLRSGTPKGRKERESKSEKVEEEQPPEKKRDDEEVAQQKETKKGEKKPDGFDRGIFLYRK